MAHARPDAPRPATWVSDARSLEHAALLAASLRTFGGDGLHLPLLVYVDPAWATPDTLPTPPDCVLRCAPGAPPGARGLPYAGKPAAAARAEEDAVGEGQEILAWLDDDTVVLAPPPFALTDGRVLGWRPVMHANIAAKAGEDPGPFWERLWELLEAPPARRFPCVTVADGDSVSSYLNAGCLVVRPSRGLLRAWAVDFARAAADSTLRAATDPDPRRRLFLHQAVLGATVSRLTGAAERQLLPESVNWPLLFKEQFGAARDFHDLTGVATLRHEGLLLRPREDWLQRLDGPEDVVAWLRGAAAGAWRLETGPQVAP
jgi:hypothetical protein